MVDLAQPGKRFDVPGWGPCVRFGLFQPAHSPLKIANRLIGEIGPARFLAGFQGV